MLRRVLSSSAVLDSGNKPGMHFPLFSVPGFNTGGERRVSNLLQNQ